MTKEAPALTVTVDDAGESGRDISNDVLTVDWATPRDQADDTGADKTARERILLLADYSATINGWVNVAANKSHDVFKSVSTSSVIRTVAIALSGQTSSAEAYFTDYRVSRAETGAMTWSAPCVLGNGSIPTW